MQTVKITIADNGVIKTIIDDNINSAGETYESTLVYDFDSVDDRIRFIEDTCVDIGLSLGNVKHKNKIKISTGWGESYTPTKTEVDQKIKSLQRQIKELQSII